VRAVHRLGHLLLLGLRSDAEQSEGRQTDAYPPERKVLVVDDSRVSAFALSSAFAANDFQVRSVATMEEALVEINGFQPCLLVSDVQMPNLDVTLLCQTFRGLSRGKRSLVVLVSGTTGPALQSRLEQIKPDAFFPKMAGTAVVVENVLQLWRACESEGKP
jgi:PleD family two-component response regulator